MIYDVLRPFTSLLGPKDTLVEALEKLVKRSIVGELVDAATTTAALLGTCRRSCIYGANVNKGDGCSPIMIFTLRQYGCKCRRRS